MALGLKVDISKNDRKKKLNFMLGAHILIFKIVVPQSNSGLSIQLHFLSMKSNNAGAPVNETFGNSSRASRIRAEGS